MEVVNYLKANNYSGIGDETTIKSELYKLDIIVSYDNTVNNGKRRFIFSSSDRSKKVFKNKLCIESNGLILEAPEWNILVSPTFSPRNNVDTSTVNEMLNQQLYDIYYVEDGTIVNFYYYHTTKSWVMSSTKGIDINNNIFNKLTYSKMFEESLEKMGLSIVDFYKQLDPLNSYTFGFKHPDIHPFMEGGGAPIWKVWFVQSADFRLTKLPDAVLDTIPATHDLPVYIQKQSPFDMIPGHTKIDFTPNSLNPIFWKLKFSMDDFIENNKSTYGFLLVAKDVRNFVDNLHYSVILLESSLMINIRKLWYSNMYVRYSKEMSFNRTQVILLNSFLDNTRYEIFNMLFPQYNEEFKLFNKIEFDLTDKIYGKLTGSEETPAVIDKKQPKVFVDKSEIVDLLSKKVSKLINISLHDRPKQKIREIIHDNSNIEYYYWILSQKRIMINVDELDNKDIENMLESIDINND